MAHAAREEVLFNVSGPIATITFNRPEARNALTWHMYERLVELCAAAERRTDVRAVVLRGAGDAAFVSGTDIGQFQAFQRPQDALAYEQRMEHALDRLERLPKPTIAVLRGICTGAGMMLALACDFRYATPDLRMGVPIARTLGNCLSMSNYARVLDLVGPGRTKELVMLARLLAAEEALQLGLVNEIVAPDVLETRVGEVATALTALAPLTLRATKEAVRRIQGRRRLEPREGEDLIVACYMSEDFRGAVRAFLDKRSFAWNGR